jgi:uncharacterized protein
MKLRRALLLLAGSIAGLYIAVLVLLAVFQRSFVFPGNTRAFDPPGADSIYTARRVAERDGTTLLVWQAPPPKPGAPTIVYFYGNGGNLTHFAAAGERFHAEGYGVVLASYRGYSGNPGHPSEEGLMADARAVLAAIAWRGPVVLWGQSLGSGVAARMASEGRGQALILESPYTSIVDVAARRFPIFPVRALMRDRFDTRALVGRIRMPVLILHGTEDWTVPYDMGVSLSRAFGREATFVPIPGARHDLHLSTLAPIAMRWLKGKGLVRFCCL